MRVRILRRRSDASLGLCISAGALLVWQFLTADTTDSVTGALSSSSSVASSIRLQAKLDFSVRIAAVAFDLSVEQPNFEGAENVTPMMVSGGWLRRQNRKYILEWW